MLDWISQLSIDLDLQFSDWIIMALCAMLVGFSKTGIVGLGIIIIPLMASILPARTSVGVVLPMLIFADLFAAAYYRQHAQWRYVVRLIPSAFVGIVVGSIIMSKIQNLQLKPIIAITILAMLALKIITSRKKDTENQKSTHAHLALGIVLGFVAGVVTMMTNAAGPLMAIYLVAMGLDKKKFMGTGAWFFFIGNWLKVPFSAKLDLITAESLKLDLVLLPLIALGAIAGIFFVKYVGQKTFNSLILILAAAGAIKLLLPTLQALITG